MKARFGILFATLLVAMLPEWSFAMAPPPPAIENSQISVEAGGSHTNPVAATITSADGHGIYAGLGASIINSGVIDTFYTGIFGEGSNIVTNSGSITSDQNPDNADWYLTGGQADGDGGIPFTGIHVEGDSTVTNNGTITSLYGNGIYIGDSSTVINNNTVDAYASGISGGNNVQVTNASGARIFSDRASTLFGTGISLGDYANVTNNGSITSEFGTGISVGSGDETTRTFVINNGTISAAHDGIETGDYAAVENHGTIISDQFDDGGGGEETGIDAGDFSSVINDGILTSEFGTAIAVGYNSTILNTSKGVITAQSASDGGIETSSGNEVLTNNGKITIERAYTGIQMYDGDDRVTNNGTLLIEYAENNGFGLGRGSDTLINSVGGTIQIDYADWVGIHFGSSSEGNDILTNRGTILIDVADAGIAMSQGDDTFDNLGAGKIQINHTLGSPAIALGGGTDVLNNEGIIELGEVAEGIQFGGSDSAEDTLNNKGKISVEAATDGSGLNFGGGADSLTNEGLVDIKIASEWGIAMDDWDDSTGHDIFTNKSGGTINIGTTDRHAIVFAGGNDILDNSGAITIENAGNSGIAMGTGTDEFINRSTGNISITSNDEGIHFGYDDEDEIFTNHGTITIISGARKAIAFPDGGNDTFTNTGTINIRDVEVGIAFGYGDDTVTVSGPLNMTNVSEAAMRGGDGDDILNLEGTGRLSLNSNIYDFEYLNKSGTGTWTINAEEVDAYGETNVMEGALAINGSLYSNEVYVWEGATLTGDLSIYSDSFETVYNDGTIAPGDNGFGTIYINSDYYSSSQATLDIEVGNGQADLLEVGYYAGLGDEGGNGQIRISPIGYVAGGENFTILRAWDGVGIYDPAALQGMLSTPSLSLDFLLELQNEETELHLLVSRIPYSALGLGGNSAFGDALLELAENGNETAGEVLTQIDRCATVGCMQEALGSFSPEQYPNLVDAGMAGLDLYRSGIIGRMGSLHLTHGSQDIHSASNRITPGGPALSRLPAFDRKADGWSGWAYALGMTGNQDGERGISGFEVDSTGVSLGFDNRVTDNLALGVGFGTTSSRVDFDRGQNTDVDGYHGGLYGTFSTPAYYLDAGVFYADNGYDSDRQPLLGPKAKSSTDGTEWGVYLGGGYNLADAASWYFIPTASLEWAKAEIDGFTEKGALLNMRVGDYDTDSLVSTLGLRLGGKLAIGETRVEPEFRLSWAHEFGETDRDVKTQFVGSTSTFSINGIEPDRDSALVGLGLNTYATDSLTLYIDYDGEFRSDFDGHTLSGGLRYNF